MRIKEEKVLMQIARLSQNQDFEMFMNLVRMQRDEALELCINEDKPARHQGAVQVLNELINAVDGAREAHRRRTSHVNNMSQSL